MDNNFEYRVYLKSLSKQFPTIADAATEIINLQAILSLPKGTEHFLTDIHGEYEQFNHVLKNGSGSVRRKIDEEFGNTLSVKDKRSLATLIYYPQEKLELVCQEEADQDVLEDWFKITIHRLVQMTKRVSSKYTRSKVRKALPHDFSYVIEELITELREKVTILIVTHNMQQAARISDFTAYMYIGEMVEFGVTDQIFIKPKRKETEDYITGRFG